MFSETSLIPGRKQQTERTMRLIFTPACEASYKALMVVLSVRPFTLILISACPPASAVLAHCSIRVNRFFCSVKGECPNAFNLTVLPNPVSC